MSEFKDKTEEFYSKIDDWAAKSPDDWTLMNVLAFFCKKYYTKNNTHFILTVSKRKNDPISSKESKDFSRLYQKFLPKDYEVMNSSDKERYRIAVYWKIYNYINWFFDFKFRNTDKSVDSTTMFLSSYFLNEFERMYMKKIKQQESTDQITLLKSWAEKTIPGIFDMHQLDRADDLKMIKKYILQYELDEMSSECRLLRKAKELKIEF